MRTKIKQVALAAAGLFIANLVMADASIQFELKTHRQDVFAVNSPASAYVSYSYEPYASWSEKGSGRYFPMDVAPTLTGLINGTVRTPAVRKIDESKYTEQAQQFAAVVNERNRDGRPQFDLKNKTPQANLQAVQADTYVVELLISGIVDKPLAQIGLTADAATSLPEKIDVDHFHFHVPGSFVEQVLEQGDAEFQNLRPDRDYLLSVFDLRDYNCALMKDGIRDYFSKSPPSERLHNESIYVISQMDFNPPTELNEAEHYFGRRPGLLIHQHVIYADHLLRAGDTYFAFFNEGARTRVVLLWNIAMKSKYFTGAKGLLLRQYLLDGVTGGALGKVTGAVVGARDKLNGILNQADDDVKQKNECNRGLAQGLIRYSEGLFSQFLELAGK